MKVFVFGNPDLPTDSLPWRLLPQLEKSFPGICFEVRDPNEDWEMPEELTVLDTVLGIKKVRVFTGLKPFLKAPRLSLHDFDLLSHLSHLKKIDKLKKVKIIGLPPHLSEKETLRQLIPILQATQP